MECEKIIQPAAAIEILQNPESKYLQTTLFNCIYCLFQNSFLSWIMNKYRYVSCKEKLREDAKDAFQNGVSVFYEKSQQKGFVLKSSLKTTIYSFGLFQLLAVFKKEKKLYGFHHYIKWVELFFEDDFIDVDQQDFIDEKEHCLIEAMNLLSKKQHEILRMKFYQKLKSREIAKQLNVTAGNIDNESAKAYKELRQILRKKLNSRLL